MKRIIYITVLLFSLTGIYSCGSDKDIEDDAEINTAMLQGREAGRRLVSREWRDTMQLQNFILEAKAKQSKYLIEGKVESAAAFDKGFVTLVKCVNPELANRIFADSLLVAADN